MCLKTPEAGIAEKQIYRQGGRLPIRWTQGGFMMNHEGEAPTLRILNAREKDNKSQSIFKIMGVTKAVSGSIVMIPRPFFLAYEIK